MSQLTLEERKREIREEIERIKQEMDIVGEEIIILAAFNEQRKSTICAPRSLEEEKLPIKKSLAEELIKLSSQCIGVTFFDVCRSCVGEKLFVYQGRGKTEFFTFRFEVEIEEERYWKNVGFELEDQILEEVLREWRRKCVRERDFQRLITGCSVYSQLFSRMNHILHWLFKDYKPLYSVKKSDLTGTIVESIRKDNNTHAPSMTVYWKISWKQNESSMGDHFVLEIPDVRIFHEDSCHRWEEFTKQGTYTVQDIEKFWMSVSVEIFE